MDRPSVVWKHMPFEKRVLAAEAFWRDQDSPDVDPQQVEAIAALAQRLKFRTRSVQALPVSQRARHLAHMSDVGDSIAMRALIAYHFAHQRPLMSAFLDALGITHEEGLITDEDVSPPNQERLSDAVRTVRDAFDPEDVNLYLHTLTALDGGTWGHLAAVIEG